MVIIAAHLNAGVILVATVGSPSPQYLFGDNSALDMLNQQPFFVKPEALSGHPAEERETGRALPVELATTGAQSRYYLPFSFDSTEGLQAAVCFRLY